MIPCHILWWPGLQQATVKNRIHSDSNLSTGTTPQTLQSRDRYFDGFVDDNDRLRRLRCLSRLIVAMNDTSARPIEGITIPMGILSTTSSQLPSSWCNEINSMPDLAMSMALIMTWKSPWFIASMPPRFSIWLAMSMRRAAIDPIFLDKVSFISLLLSVAAWPNLLSLADKQAFALCYSGEDCARPHQWCNE